MARVLRRFLNDRNGATAIEYGLIIALLSVVIAGAVSNLGGKLYTLISSAAAATH